MAAADAGRVTPFARPIVVAHRALHAGAISRPAHGPRENTVEAIEAAAAAGADAVELDVRVTRDGRLALGHDNLQWAPGRRPYVVSWSRRASMGFLSDLGQAVEVATATRLDLKLDVKDARTLATVAAWCRAGEVDHAHMSLWCRSAQEIRQLGNAGDFAEIALLSNSSDVDAYLAAASACGAGAVSLHPRAVTAGAIAEAHQRGLTVYAWILDPNRHRTAVEAGVDGLVTDWVGAALAARG